LVEKQNCLGDIGITEVKLKAIVIESEKDNLLVERDKTGYYKQLKYTDLIVLSSLSSTEERRLGKFWLYVLYMFIFQK